MTPAEAFAALSLTPGASPAAVRTMYRRKAQDCHPDAPGGNAAAFNRLALAHATALAYAREEPCPACAGAGKRRVYNGLSHVDLPCAECGGGGLRHG